MISPASISGRVSIMMACDIEQHHWMSVIIVKVTEEWETAPMQDKILTDEVRDLGGGKFSVRLTLTSPEGAISQIQTVAADGSDRAVQIAKEAFSAWLKQVAQYTVRNLPPSLRN